MWKVWPLRFDCDEKDIVRMVVAVPPQFAGDLLHFTKWSREIGVYGVLKIYEVGVCKELAPFVASFAGAVTATYLMHRLLGNVP